MDHDKEGKELLRLLGNVDSDTRLAIEKFLFWSVENPREVESHTEEQLKQMIEEVRLENIRRRLGGKVNEILSFKKSERME